MTTAVISACSDSEATIHLIHRDKQDSTSSRCLLGDTAFMGVKQHSSACFSRAKALEYGNQRCMVQEGGCRTTACFSLSPSSITCSCDRLAQGNVGWCSAEPQPLSSTVTQLHPTLCRLLGKWQFHLNFNKSGNVQQVSALTYSSFL